MGAGRAWRTSRVRSQGRIGNYPAPPVRRKPPGSRGSTIVEVIHFSLLVRVSAMQALMFLLLCPAVPLDAKGEDLPRELTKLQGIWKPTALESRGTELPVERLGTSGRYTLVIVGNGYALSTHGGTLKIDATKQAVDLAITDGRYKGTTLLGLYELKDNTLRLALPSPLAAG